MYAGRKIVFYVKVEKASKSNFVFWEIFQLHCDYIKNERKMMVVIWLELPLFAGGAVVIVIP